MVNLVFNSSVKEYFEVNDLPLQAPRPWHCCVPPNKPCGRYPQEVQFYKYSLPSSRNHPYPTALGLTGDLQFKHIFYQMCGSTLFWYYGELSILTSPFETSGRTTTIIPYASKLLVWHSRGLQKGLWPVYGKAMTWSCDGKRFWRIWTWTGSTGGDFVSHEVRGPERRWERYQSAYYHTVRGTDGGGVDRTTDVAAYGISAGECRGARSGGGYIFKWVKEVLTMWERVSYFSEKGGGVETLWKVCNWSWNGAI